MKINTIGLSMLLVVCIASGLVQARDRGFNQPGAVGNVHRDPGINQPGAVGNVGAAAPVAVDPGLNQPGAVGNAPAVMPGVDPGLNQPGAVGNVHRDPGLINPVR